MSTETYKPLNIIVLYSAGHLGSAIVMNRLINMPEVNVVGVVKAQTLQLSFKERNKIKQHFKKLGWRFAWLLVWQRFMQGFGFAITLLLPFLRKRLQPAWKIADQRDIPIHHCLNINSEESLGFINSLQPDLLVSAYFSQILKKTVIESPKLGILNLHPGWLPGYKGAMAYFWVLKNNMHNNINNKSNKAGVSIHWIDEGIDTGELLARRSFSLPPQSTQDTVLRFTAIIGSNLLQRVFKKLIKGETLKAVVLNTEEEDHYYPMPLAKDFEDYFKERRFFRIRDTLGFYLFKKW